MITNKITNLVATYTIRTTLIFGAYAGYRLSDYIRQRWDYGSYGGMVENTLEMEEFPEEGEDRPLAIKTNFRIFILRKLRETCHIDDWVNSSENRRILKKKVSTLMRTNNPDIRDADVYEHADIIVELFFIPTENDLFVRGLRYSDAAVAQRNLYANIGLTPLEWLLNRNEFAIFRWFLGYKPRNHKTL